MPFFRFSNVGWMSHSFLKHVPRRSYHPAKELMHKNTPKFFSDPNEVGEELVRLISLHDKIKDPKVVKLGATFEQMGLDSLDFVECILEIENYLSYDFGAADWEQFITINDIAQFISRDYFGQKH